MTVSNSGSFLESPDHSCSLPDSSYRGAINAAALKELTDRTGYSLVQNNGQRKYGGPPPNWDAPTPSKGCEVFIGKIPRDLYEDDLVPVLEKAGKLYELRLMMDFSNHNRGYAFCMYTNKHSAIQAVKRLNNYEIRPGRNIGVCISIDNCRLFVGGIPKNRTREELLYEMSQISSGVTDCIMKLSASDKTKNRGFAFIEYESHRAAAMARRKLIPGKIPLWGQQIKVDWAEPEAQVDDDVMSKVKILYVSGLSLTTKEETIEQVFGQYNPKAIERVKKMKDYAFVHFNDRRDAEEALEKLDGTLIEGAQIEVTYSKPVDKDQMRYAKTSNKSMPPLPIPPNFFEQSAGQVMGDAMANVFSNRSNGLPYMGNGSHLGMNNCNQIFPYSSNGSGSSLPSSVRGQVGKGSAGMRGAGVKSQYNKWMAQVQATQQQQQQLALAFQRAGGYMAAPNLPGPNGQMDSISSASHAAIGKRPNEILEELCTKNGWGAPVYTLLQGPNSVNGVPQYMFRVQIFMAKDQDGTGVGMIDFQPPLPKLCTSVDQAKIIAAEHTLVNIIQARNGIKDLVPRNNGPICPTDPHTASMMGHESIYDGGVAAMANNNSLALAYAVAAANQSVMATFPNSAAMFGRAGALVNGAVAVEGSPPLNKFM